MPRSNITRKKTQTGGTKIGVQNNLFCCVGQFRHMHCYNWENNNITSQSVCAKKSQQLYEFF